MRVKLLPLGGGVVTPYATVRWYNTRVYELLDLFEQLGQKYNLDNRLHWVRINNAFYVTIMVGFFNKGLVFKQEGSVLTITWEQNTILRAVKDATLADAYVAMDWLFDT